MEVLRYVGVKILRCGGVEVWRNGGVVVRFLECLEQVRRFGEPGSLSLWSKSLDLVSQVSSMSGASQEVWGARFLECLDQVRRFGEPGS